MRRCTEACLDLMHQYRTSAIILEQYPESQTGIRAKVLVQRNQHTVKLQWLEHLRNYENMFETGVIRANEC